MGIRKAVVGELSGQGWFAASVGTTWSYDLYAPDARRTCRLPDLDIGFSQPPYDRGQFFATSGGSVLIVDFVRPNTLHVLGTDCAERRSIPLAGQVLDMLSTRGVLLVLRQGIDGLTLDGYGAGRVSA